MIVDSLEKLRQGTDQEHFAQALVHYKAMRSLPHFRLPVRESDVALINACSPFRCGANDEIAGWEIGEGPPVGLIHGWGGQGIQLVKFAHHLAHAGYRAVLIDARNHGASASASLGFDRFMIDGSELQNWLGRPPLAWVGHSAGALAMVAAMRTHSISAKAFVCIAAPFFPYVPANPLRAAGVADAIIEQVKPHIAAEFRSDWESLENGVAWQLARQIPVLAVYDRDDAMIEPFDAMRLAKVCPDATIVETSGWGHNRLLSSPEVMQATTSFLAEAFNRP